MLRPFRESDYSNLPPAVSFVGSIELFRDEAVEYIKNLRKYNIKANFKVFEGCYHAFDMMLPWCDSAKEAKRFFMKSFDYACKNYYAPQR